MGSFFAFLAVYCFTIFREWTAWLGALLGLVALVEFYWKPIVPRITPVWKVRLAIALILFSQAAAYKTLYDRVGANRAIIDRLSKFIDEAAEIKVRNRVTSPREYDYTSPKTAVAWEAAVCDYLTKAKDRSFCIRFKNRLPPLDNPDNQRRDGLEAAVDARLERLEQLQLELAKP